MWYRRGYPSTLFEAFQYLNDYKPTGQQRATVTGQQTAERGEVVVVAAVTPAKQSNSSNDSNNPSEDYFYFRTIECQAYQ